MRILLIGVLSAPLIGCVCPPSPQATTKACTSKGCLQRSAAGAPIEDKSAAFKPNPATATGKPSFEATNATKSKSPNGATRDDKAGFSTAGSPQSSAPPQSTENAKTVIATKVDASGQPSDIADPVLKKAKTTVASKMEDPASAEFADMKRAMRTDVVGQSVDTICGHVEGKTASGEATGKRPFLYFVKDDVAFVDYGKSGSVAADAYRTMCSSPDLHGKDLRQ